MLKLKLRLLTVLLHYCAKLYARQTRLDEFALHGLLRVLSALIFSIMRDEYSANPLLALPKHERAVAFQNYARDWVRYLAIVARTPTISVHQLLSIFRDYSVNIDPEIDRSLQDRKPTIVFTYHRADLPDIIASLGTSLIRSARYPAPRIVVVRKLPVTFREVVWACIGTVVGGKLTVISTCQKNFRELLLSEFSYGSILICACDVPNVRASTSWAGNIMGMETSVELGLLKYVADRELPLAYLAADQTTIHLRFVPYGDGDRKKRFQTAASKIIECSNQDSSTSGFNWVGWSEHLPLPLSKTSEDVA